MVYFKHLLEENIMPPHIVWYGGLHDCCIVFALHTHALNPRLAETLGHRAPVVTDLVQTSFSESLPMCFQDSM